MNDIPETTIIGNSTPPDKRLHQPSVKEAFLGKVELFQRFAINQHWLFDQSVWGQNQDARLFPQDYHPPSYHNEHHIAGMTNAVQALFEALKKGNDVFYLNEELNKWNMHHAYSQPFNLDDLEIALQLAVSCHDLGNITKSAIITDKVGLPTLDLSNKYEAEAGTAVIETRSADITEKLIDHFFTTEEDLEIINRLKPLIRHLIMQTVFDPSKTYSEQPFWQFIQLTDQIGTFYFSPQSRTQIVAGLLNEMRVRRDKPPNLAKFLNFPEEREQALIPDEERRRNIHTIFQAFDGNEIDLFLEGIFDTIDRAVDYLNDIKVLMTLPAPA